MGGIFGGSPKIPDLPPIPKPKVVRLPTPDDPESIERQRRIKQAALRRGGRGSTILTEGLGKSVGSSGQTLGK